MRPGALERTQDVSPATPPVCGRADRRRRGRRLHGHVTRLASADQYTQSTANTTALADDAAQHQRRRRHPFPVDIKTGDTLDTIAGPDQQHERHPVYATVAGGKLVISGKIDRRREHGRDHGGTTAGFAFTQTAAAHDALLTVDSGLGPVPDRERDHEHVTNAIPGVTLTLKSPTTAAITWARRSGRPARSATRSRLFVDQYNSTISYIRGELNEQPVAHPQSDADRTKGILNGDASLESLLTHCASAVGGPRPGPPRRDDGAVPGGVSTGAPSGAIDPDAVAGQSYKLDTAAN